MDHIWLSNGVKGCKPKNGKTYAEKTVKVANKNSLFNQMRPKVEV